MNKFVYMNIMKTHPRDLPHVERILL